MTDVETPEEAAHVEAGERPDEGPVSDVDDDTTRDDETARAAQEDTTPLDLWTWGLSGQPATWALSTWVTVIEMIRGVNRGALDASAVQDALDAVFPDKGYQASDVVLAHPPVGDFTATVTDPATNTVRVELVGDADLGLPDDNVRWDFGDQSPGVHGSGGWDHTYESTGEYRIRLTEWVAGTAYTSDEMVSFGDEHPSETAKRLGGIPDPVSGIINPAVLGRDATVFESETDDQPNTSVTEEQSSAQAEAVGDYIEAGRMVPGDAYEGVGGENYPSESGPTEPEHASDEDLPDTGGPVSGLPDNDKQTTDSGTTGADMSEPAETGTPTTESEPETGMPTTEPQPVTEPEPTTEPTTEPQPVGVDTPDDTAAPGTESGTYDPSEHTVEEVLNYAADHPDEVASIRAAEEAGKNRVTLLDRLS